MSDVGSLGVNNTQPCRLTGFSANKVPNIYTYCSSENTYRDANTHADKQYVCFIVSANVEPNVFLLLFQNTYRDADVPLDKDIYV